MRDFHLSWDGLHWGYDPHNCILISSPIQLFYAKKIRIWAKCAKVWIALYNILKIPKKNRVENLKAFVTSAKWLYPWHTSQMVMSSNAGIIKGFTIIVHLTMVASNDLIIIWRLENFLGERTYRFFLGSTSEWKHQG